ncbi:tetratricopeptide repeat protein [Candidatus Similichlamydia epinepheli]|uniref:tetratricopeptide repeat protein n=1 Tax=Candidatus Similichlamydia epinepheli TaxID=1903953 RepID=UPI000D3B8BBB|nr:tetratricopeptide repeat protein [Candidatus Similichlamydia epinepheli]
MRSKRHVLGSRISSCGATRCSLVFSAFFATACCYASYGGTAQKWLDGCSSLHAEDSLTYLESISKEKYGRWNPLRWIFGSKAQIVPAISCDLGAVYEQEGKFDLAFAAYEAALPKAISGSLSEVKLLLGLTKCAKKLDRQEDAEKYASAYLEKCPTVPTVVLFDKFIAMVPGSFSGAALRRELLEFEKIVKSIPETANGSLVTHTVTQSGLVFLNSDPEIVSAIEKSELWKSGDVIFRLTKISIPDHKLHWLSDFHKGMRFLNEEKFTQTISCLEKAVIKFDQFNDSHDIETISTSEKKILSSIASALMFEQFQSHFSRQCGDCGEMAILKCMKLLRDAGDFGSSIRRFVLKSMLTLPGKGAFQILNRVASESLNEWKAEVSIGQVDGLFFIDALDVNWVLALDNFLMQCAEQAPNSAVLSKMRSCTRSPSASLLFPECESKEEINDVLTLLLSAFMEQWIDSNGASVIGQQSTDLLLPVIEIGYGGI